MKKWLPVILLILACLPVLWALVKPGFFITHDGEFNLVRLMHFDNEIRNGQFPVRWAYDLDYKFGSPLFNFFYPLTYYLGSLIHFFGPDYGSSLKLLIAIATVGAVLAMYRFLRGHFSVFAAFMGTLLYLYVPYRLVVTYVTGSYGILLSLVFLPLALWAVDQITAGRRRFSALLAICVFGLLTAHNVTSLILLPILVGYALLHKPSLPSLLGFLLGIGLAAFFLLPAFAETKYVFLSQGIVVDFRDHFPTLKQLIYSKWGYFYSVPGEGDGMSFQVGLAQWLVWGIATSIATAALLRKKKMTENRKLAVFFALVFALSIFFMLPVSMPLWEKIPLLPQIQFPWRILAATIVAIPFLGAFLTEMKFGKALIIMIIALMFYANRNNLRTWETIRYTDASYAARQNLYYGSTDIAWETRPIWVDVKPTWMATTITEINPVIKIEKEDKLPDGKIEISATATAAVQLVVNRFYYPIWKATVDGNAVKIVPSKDKGLLSFDLSPGKHEIVIEQTKTGVEKIADGISLTSLLILFFLILQ